MHGLDDMTVQVPPGESGVAVEYDVIAYDRDPYPTVACTPESGSYFPVGSTTVTCTATDRSGNVATGSFAVHVVVFDIDVSTAGSVDRSGRVTVSGTVSCSPEAAGGIIISGTVEQLVAPRATISGTFGISTDCTGPQSPWSAVVVGANGTFARGNATVTVYATTCQPTCHGDSESQRLRLTGKK